MFRNLSIKSRLVFVIGFLSLLLTGNGIVGTTSLSTANDSLKTMFEDQLLPMQQVSQIARLIGDNQMGEMTQQNAALVQAASVFKLNVIKRSA